MGLAVSNNVNVFAVTGLKSDAFTQGLKATKFLRTAVEIFNEEAGKRGLADSVNLVVEPVLRKPDSWKLVKSVGNFAFGSSGASIDPKHFAVGSALYPEDVKEAASIGYKTVVSPMTHFSVLQAAKESGINAVPAISDSDDVEKLERQIKRLDSSPSIVKVFPFNVNGSQGLVDALGGPFSREIQTREVSLVADETSSIDTPTKFWTALIKANKGDQIRIGNPPLSRGLNFVQSVERFESGISSPVVTGGVKADAASIQALIAGGVRNIGLSALITDEVQVDAAGPNPNYDKLRANISAVLDGVKSGLVPA